MGAHERRKARWMACAEQLIDELVEWSEKTPQPKLTEIEDKVLELRKRFGEALAQGVVEEQEAKQPVPGPTCPQCGREMTYKGQKEITPHTWVGEVQIQRGYYHCPRCRVGIFPPG